ncbi:unnamed protein product, partial [marine sediment metagenome]
MAEIGPDVLGDEPGELLLLMGFAVVFFVILYLY